MVDQWVKDLCENTFGKSSMKVGKIIQHPDGYKVKVIDGQYWGTHGLSNFWYWQRVLPDGKLSKKVEHGYGW